MNIYRSKEWKSFRTEALRLGDERCARCFHSRVQGAVLHVHHRIYIAGRKPWEYSHEDCELLCQSCHAQEHGIIPPKTDWEFVGYDDFGAPDGHCDYCNTEIRHVYMIQHQKWATLEVGEICCDNLTTTNFATSHMKERRRFLERQKRFTSHWKVDADGSYVQHKGILVRIIAIDDSFKLLMNGRVGGRLFDSPIEAKIRAFEVLDSGEAASYLQRTE
jgi:hypothetical protein